VILIGSELEQALAAITCCCGFVIDWAVLDKIKLDCRENQVDEKQYVLHKSRRACVVAQVDEYEPEVVTLTLVGRSCKHFNAIVAAASMPGFGQHAFFLDCPIAASRTLADAIHSTLNAESPNDRFARVSLVAVRNLDAITRCFLRSTTLSPTPYVVCATNMRTMATRRLQSEESDPYSIKGHC
jgi:hypothetical protein